MLVRSWEPKDGSKEGRMEGSKERRMEGRKDERKQASEEGRKELIKKKIIMYDEKILPTGISSYD